MTLHRILLHSLVSALIGYLGWHGEVYGLAFLPLLFLIWQRCRDRREVFCALFAYYVAAGRGLLHGAGVFFAKANEVPSLWIGLAIWLVPSALLALGWVCSWGRRRHGVRMVVLLALLTLPPLGIVGWANPLSAAGALFPSFGWQGLAFTLLLCYVLVTPFPSLAVPLVLVSALINLAVDPAASPVGWVGVDTALGASHGIEDEFNRLQVLQRLVGKESAAAPDGTIFVLPELVGGDWAINRVWWSRAEKALAAKRQTVLLGVSEQEQPNSHQLTNKLIGIGTHANVSLVDRVPVPVAMWQPWSDDGVASPWFQSGVGLVGSTRVAHLICYEQLLVWPTLVSMAQSPDIVVGVANGWWAKGTSIPAIQREAVNTWARLFHKPVIYAQNG